MKVFYLRLVDQLEPDGTKITSALSHYRSTIFTLSSSVYTENTMYAEEFHNAALSTLKSLMINARQTSKCIIHGPAIILYYTVYYYLFIAQTVYLDR